jgi:hypothetical protein
MLNCYCREHLCKHYTVKKHTYRIHEGVFHRVTYFAINEHNIKILRYAKNLPLSTENNLFYTAFVLNKNNMYRKNEM